MANLLQLIGLVSDFIGVVIMATDILKIDKKIGTWEWLGNARENSQRNKMYTVKGLIFIGAGFLLQAAATIINMMK